MSRVQIDYNCDKVESIDSKWVQFGRDEHLKLRINIINKHKCKWALDKLLYSYIASCQPLILLSAWWVEGEGRVKQGIPRDWLICLQTVTPIAKISMIIINYEQKMAFKHTESIKLYVMRVHNPLWQYCPLLLVIFRWLKKYWCTPVPVGQNQLVLVCYR